jgi:hypothetical protein
MKEYNYHPQYKYYISEGTALESPLEPGEYLVSAFATLTPPPKVENNQIQIFNIENNSWEIKENQIGIYYNIFTGVSFYNENPLEKPDNYTKIKPPLDYNQNNYKWNSEYDFWEKIDPVYHVTESQVKSLSVEEKLKKLNISVDQLKDILEINTHSNDIKNISNVLEVVNLPIEEKFNFLNINQDQIKNLLGISEIINSPLEGKLNLLNISIEDLKNILQITKLLAIVEECKLEQTLLLRKLSYFSNILEEHFSLSNSSQHINPINLFNISILRPYEIIQTSEKFESDDLILDSLFVGICIDTGERKFGNGINSWNDLPTIPSSQRYRFSRTLEKWQTENPIPANDIECYESDTGNLKIGNGFLTWDKLPYEGA